MLDEHTLALYAKALNRGQWGRIRSALTGRSRQLFTMAEIDTACTVSPQRRVGIRTVAISDIRGTEGRSQDFDHDFNPLKNHNRLRWLGVARARLSGKTMPPVDLAQVGDVYFVQDGHHRISVARAIGQLDIEAEVTVWRVSGPLPWETPTQETTAFGRLYTGVRGESVRLRERIEHSAGSFKSSLAAKLKPWVVA